MGQAGRRIGDHPTVSRCDDATTTNTKRMRNGSQSIAETPAAKPSECPPKPRKGKPRVYKFEREARNRTKAEQVQRQLNDKLAEEQEQRLLLEARKAQIVAQKDAEAPQARGDFMSRLHELEATHTALEERYTKAVGEATERVQFLREKEIEAEALWEEALRQIELSHLELDRRQISESDRDRLREQACNLEAEVSKLRKMREEEEAKRMEQQAKRQEEEARRHQAVKAAVASQQAVFKITSASVQDRKLELGQARRELTNREAEHQATLDALRFHLREHGLPGLAGHAHGNQPQSDGSNGEAGGLQPADTGDRDPQLTGDRDPQLTRDRDPQLTGDRDADLAAHVKRLDHEIQALKTAMLASRAQMSMALRGLRRRFSLDFLHGEHRLDAPNNLRMRLQQYTPRNAKFRSEPRKCPRWRWYFRRPGRTWKRPTRSSRS